MSAEAGTLIVGMFPIDREEAGLSDPKGFLRTHGLRARRPMGLAPS